MTARALAISLATEPGACDVIEAEFVFGPIRCMKWTDYTTEDGGETFRICEDHIAATGSEVPS